MLETVIPKAGGRVRVLQGQNAGDTGSVQQINEDRFSVTVALYGNETGKLKPTSTLELPYEDLCKEC